MLDWIFFTSDQEPGSIACVCCLRSFHWCGDGNAVNEGFVCGDGSAEEAGHEADDPGSMVGDSMPELRREAVALGADAVALAEAYSSLSRQRAGAFGLSAGVAMDLRMGPGAASRPGQS